MKEHVKFFNTIKGQEECNMLDIVLTIVSAICTVFSILGAVRSNIYYRKSRQLTMYANTNVAFMETQKIIAAFPELLKLANNTRKRGTNSVKEVAKHGENIKKSINKIRESLPVEDYKEIQELLNTRELKVEEYIDSFITGEVLVDEKFVSDAKFTKCQNKFYEIQLLLKKKLEELSEKLK